MLENSKMNVYVYVHMQIRLQIPCIHVCKFFLSYFQVQINSAVSREVKFYFKKKKMNVKSNCNHGQHCNFSFELIHSHNFQGNSARQLFGDARYVKFAIYIMRLCTWVQCLHTSCSCWEETFFGAYLCATSIYICWSSTF